MKNGKMKLNKTKILARVMLVVILLASAINLSSCVSSGKVCRNICFNSHSELLAFVEEYNSKNDGFVYTFVSFDFDNHDTVHTDEYCFATVWDLVSPLSFSESKYRKMYDKDHSKGFGFDCEMIFYMDDFLDGEKTERAYKIYCVFETKKDYNFYQYDQIEMKYIDCYDIDDYNDKFDEIGCYYSDADEYELRFIDQNSYNLDNSCYDRYYSYLYMYQIQINGNDEVRVDITSENELTKEKIDEICQLLMDNMVIINTEG